MFLKFIGVIPWFLCISIVSSQDRPQVHILDGVLEGIYLKSRDGRQYSAFMGIPYANPPERFELANPASSWSGIKDASNFGSVCAQFDVRIQAVTGSEDCLFINVFTPNVTGNLPVLAFIHGGGFQFGNSNQNGADYLMDENVILVTFNYRLGPYGFMSTGDDVLPGNLGMKDQVLALKWIQANIERFGGVASDVMLFGESAGAAATSLHILSPMSRGLFRQAACMSGTALNTWAVTEEPMKNTIPLAERLNCPISSSSGIKDCIKEKSTEEIYAVDPSNTKPFSNPPYVPTIERKGSSNAFLTEPPRSIYENGKFAKIPLIISANENEGLLIHSAVIMKDKELTKMVNEKWFEMAPSLFQYDSPKFSDARKKEISKAILSFYFQNRTEPISEDTFQNLTNIFSDSMFIYGSRETALLHAPHAPTYTTILSIHGIWSQIFSFGYTKVLGMTHADDLQYYFSCEKYPKFLLNSDTMKASKHLVRMLAHFAKFGNPNLESEIVSEQWKPVSGLEIASRKLKWMYIKNTEQEIEISPLEDRMDFWDQHYKPISDKNLPKNEL